MLITHESLNVPQDFTEHLIFICHPPVSSPQVQGIYHQDELQGYIVDISVVKLDVLTSDTRDSPNSSGGDIGAYLNDFCAWQMRNNPSDDSNPQHWDHALMLSG